MRLEAGAEVLEAVVGALVAERLALGPRATDDLDPLRRPVVALVLVQEVALARLLGVAAARDDVHDRTAVRELVESGELLRGDGREDGVGPHGDDRLDRLGGGGDGRGDDERVGARAAVGHEGVVEAGVLERAGVVAQVVGIEPAPGDAG